MGKKLVCSLNRRTPDSKCRSKRTRLPVLAFTHFPDNKMRNRDKALPFDFSNENRVNVERSGNDNSGYRVHLQFHSVMPVLPK
jgi:hypothetical protein